MIKRNIFEPVLPGSSKCISVSFIIKRSEEDLYICDDDKICSDSYQIPNIELPFHSFSGIKYNPWGLLLKLLHF